MQERSLGSLRSFPALAIALSDTRPRPSGVCVRARGWAERKLHEKRVHVQYNALEHTRGPCIY
jgi:hypothetical protein